MRKDLTIYLEDIVDAITHIVKYTSNSTQEAFEEDDYMQDAVIRRFEIIGEAVKHIPEDFRKTHQEVPWKLATGMRDVLIHNYNEVNFERLWKTIKEDLPHFKKQIEEILHKKIF
jgi:uncharacterized protein with HEPN domain